MEQAIPANKLSYYFTLLKQAINGHEMDYTSGSLRKAVLMLAIPMMLEMCMESVFAVVDLYFVGHLKDASHAIQTVGLTESVLTIIYSLAIGMSMAATAVVARRIGEKNPEAAAHAGIQAIVVALAVTILISIGGWVFAADILRWMGASADTVLKGTGFVRIMMGASIVIMLLFLINGIFRGAGNAAMAMKSLWLANICNIILCPILINGLGPIPALGLEGAAWATVIGRGSGVVYQLYHLINGSSQLKIKEDHWGPDWAVIGSLVKIAAPGILQFIIGSCSWIFLAQLVATTGGETGSAGYQTALRLMMFFLLPAWGLSNSAATLVGQNLGAKQLQRAEESVKKTIYYNVIFMAVVTVIFWVMGNYLVSFFTADEAIRKVATQAGRIIASGYVFYGIGMVMMNTFNGAGDTWTPTIINFCGFWLIQIPLAYMLAKYFEWGPLGVFIAIPVAETAITLAGYFYFRKGKWKTIKV
ncbi:MATE family efflux transporter [Ferruginibacter paludis]|uniref:MATE family efflux transporter n=1 Tax=Ferruginibacter paludis TaxID=1310417 RepID=UPI0025B2D2D9|nr:MATE family efflux transporter [Ferruginibacter paludis]MDN3659439.1 MATE family efflux transporter [Ferruginibacter paludis]